MLYGNREEEIYRRNKFRPESINQYGVEVATTSINDGAIEEMAHVNCDTQCARSSHNKEMENTEIEEMSSDDSNTVDGVSDPLTQDTKRTMILLHNNRDTRREASCKEGPY